MASKIIVLSQGPYHVAVFKPHNMAVVGGRGVIRPTLLDLVRKMFGKNIFPVHRLDRVTAGIVLFARSPFAKLAIENAFKKRLVKKTYYAICEGSPSFKKITVDQPLKKKQLNTRKSGPQVKQSIDDKGDFSITNFLFLRQLDENFCLIQAQPVSGRMHQIRAHLAYLGLPIIGDKLYGAKKKCDAQTIALCAIAISLPLPKGGRLELDVSYLFEPAHYIN
jgi:23S rRNA pseudouridine955/2504/2580 synthase